MTSILLQPRCDGVDAASFARVTNFQPIVNAGYKWVSFYLGGNYGVGKAQIDAAWRVGLPIMLNYERAADAALGGELAGRTAAVTALSQAKQLGFLGEAPIVFSGVDFGPTAAQYPALDAYHHALVDVLEPVGWTGGSYGPRNYLSRLAVADWWPDDWPLWHWGGDGYTIYEWAWAKQWYGKKPASLGDPRNNFGIGYAIDENTLLKPMKFWSGYGPDHVDPAEEDDMDGAQDARLKKVEKQVGELVTIMTDASRYGTNTAIEWMIPLIYTGVQNLPAAVVKALPPGQAGGWSEDQIVEAVLKALRKGTG